MELLPQHKLDIERADAIVRLGYPAVEPIMTELFTWLQDLNWPVAEALWPFFVSIGAPLAPYVRYVLTTEDDIWKYWVLRLVCTSPALAKSLQSDLEQVISDTRGNPDQDELLEEATHALDVARTGIVNQKD